MSDLTQCVLENDRKAMELDSQAPFLDGDYGTAADGSHQSGGGGQDDCPAGQAWCRASNKCIKHGGGAWPATCD